MDNIGLQPPQPPIVTVEEPKIIKPAGGFGRTMKKHGLKFLMGGLLTLLLGAGVWLEVNVVQQKQQVESQAQGNGEPGKYCVGSRCHTNVGGTGGYNNCTVDSDCVVEGGEINSCPAGTELQCGPVEPGQGSVCSGAGRSWCNDRFPSNEVYTLACGGGGETGKTCMKNCSCCPPGSTRTAGATYEFTYEMTFDPNGPEGPVLLKCNNQLLDEYMSTSNPKFNCREGDGGETEICSRTNICRAVTCETSASPSPSPSPTIASPSPSPASNPTISCTGLTTNVTAPVVGQSVTGTCHGSFSSVAAPVARFGVSINGGEFMRSEIIPLNAAGTANYTVTVPMEGNYVVQCQICTDATGSTCTTWGQAN